MSGQRVGYTRVSSMDQNPGRQLDGVPLDRTFTDSASGRSTARPQLEAMLNPVPLLLTPRTAVLPATGAARTP